MAKEKYMNKYYQSYPYTPAFINPLSSESEYIDGKFATFVRKALELRNESQYNT